VPVLPAGPLATRVLDHVLAVEAPAIAHHSVRSYLFAEIIAAHEGMRPGGDYDPEVLFHACVLHDLGTSPQAPGTERFEVEGADLAAAFLTGAGLEAAAVDQVWEAIALHSSSGIAERRGPITRLTREGVGLDFGRRANLVPDAVAAAIHARFPRLAMTTTLVDAIVAHATRSPATNAPAYSIARDLLREREAGGVTSLERAATGARWGL
jgi:hypothetical protein